MSYMINLMLNNFGVNMTIKLRDKISAEITAINDEEMTLKYNDLIGRLRVIDYEWDCVGVIDRIKKRYKVGDVIDVIVINIKDNLFLASHKDCFPDLNPWKNPELYVVGEAFDAIVIERVPFGFFVKLSTGAKALLPKDGGVIDFDVNKKIKVTIKEVDPKLEKIIVISRT